MTLLMTAHLFLLYRLVLLGCTSRNKTKIKNMKWIKSFIRKVCTLNIIMSKTTLVSMDLMDDLKAMNKTFKDKIDNPTSEGNQT